MKIEAYDKYTHDKYGEIMVATVLEIFTEYDAQSGNNEEEITLVAFSDEFDEDGCKEPLTQEEIHSFIKNVMEGFSK